MGHIVHDAHGELALGALLLQLLVHGEDAGGRRVLAGETVAAADDAGLTAGSGKGGDNIHIEGLALSAGLLGAVKDGHALHGLGDAGKELVGPEGTVEANLHQTHLLAPGVQVVDDLFGHIADAAHGDDHPVGIGGAVVVEELVVGAQLGVDLGHVGLYDLGESVVVAVGGLAVLEVDVAVLVAAAHGGVLGVQAALTEGVDGVPVQHIGQILVIPYGHLLNFVGGAEAIEEVQEGNATLNGGQMRHGGEVHDLLHVGLGQHGKAGLTAGVHILMVAEDRQGVGGQSTGGNMEHGGQQLTGELVHIGDHQQQTLRGGVGGGQGAGVQRAVNGTGGTGLGLHFHYADEVAEDILATLGGPAVNIVGHGAGGGDGVDGGKLGVGVGHVRRRGVAVHGNEITFNQISHLLLKNMICRAVGGFPDYSISTRSCK